MKQTGRIEWIDALRGASILLMVIYHFCYNIMVYGYLPSKLFYHPAIEGLQLVFSSAFIAICGFSSCYSHNNIRRGLQLLLLASAITIITTFMQGEQILFGILHLLGVCILLYAALQKILNRIPLKVQPYGYLGLFLLSCLMLRFLNTAPADNPSHLWILGIYDAQFESADYFPLFPWFFMFLFGTWFGKLTREYKMPSWFYKPISPLLSTIGRHTLLIYMIHQPIIILILYLFTGTIMS